jgi:hypothetical protein
MWIVGPANLSGGQDAHTTYDSGSVSVTVNGVQSIANYGSSDSTTTISSALAAAVNGNTSSSVTASAGGNVVTLTANDAGSSSNYLVSTLVTWNSSLFSQQQRAHRLPQADAAAATGNAQAAARVTTETTKHGWWIFSWTETSIKISGDINTFRALSPNASKLADLVTSKDTVAVSYDQYAKPSVWANGVRLNGGSMSYTPSEGYDPQAFIDPSRTSGAPPYDPDAVAQHIPQANTAEEFGHEVLGHIWGEMFGGDPAMVNGHASRANMRDSIIGEDAVRALDPARGQKGLGSYHNYNDPDNVP